MNRFCSIALLVLIAAVAAPLSALGQEWTRFRGPNGTGLSDTTFPAKWTAADYAWNTELPGTGHSSPVVWGDKVFVTCAQETTAERMVVCISAKTGQVEWKKDYGSHTFAQNKDNSYASSTPVVDADRVYVNWVTPEEFTLIALTHDGKEIWKADLGSFITQHGGGNSPIVVGDTVMIGGEQEGKGKPSFLFGVDAATGKIRWKTPRKTLKFSGATPIIFHPASGADQIIFSSQGEGITAVDPKTGKVIWQKADCFDSRTVGSPVTSDGMIFATCGEGPGGHILNAIRPDGNSGTVVWSTKDATPYVPTPIIKGDLLFYWSDSGMVTCVHASTGKQVWQHRVPGSYYCSPICAGNTLFSVSKKGDVVAISAGEKFELLGQTALNDKCHATPAISGGKMFVRTYTRLICVKGSGGQARSE
ncbi:MAG TPA: PQQ-binding-like beta-propeller repeat protein [Tepidisphaeraceae bacterium]|jgi:outer membrane protein assembly factor BamB|nr:PQQ-binding-like beta-propeller repeat protein [Tepidisphaeraceae bacterium]